MINLEKKYTKEELQKIIYDSTSISEIVLKIGYKKNGGSYNVRIKKFLEDNGFDLSKLQGRHIKRYSNKGVPFKNLSELLVENSTVNTNSLKKRLIRYGVKKYKCENPKCGISEWNGEPITLQLHHINGNHYDNRLENLVLLCPNCHSQTSNFTSKNSKDLNNELSKIAIDEAKTSLENLLLFEKNAKQYKKENCNLNKIKIFQKKERKCKYCGNVITKKGKIFCSVDCMTNYQRNNSKIKIEDVIEKSKEYKSLIELSRYFKISDNGLKKRLKNEGKFEEVEKNLKLNKEKEDIILQFDLNHNFIKEWKNAIEIAEYFKTSKNNIYKCCRNSNKTCCGFIWKFKNK